MAGSTAPAMARQHTHDLAPQRQCASQYLEHAEEDARRLECLDWDETLPKLAELLCIAKDMRTTPPSGGLRPLKEAAISEWSTLFHAHEVRNKARIAFDAAVKH